MPCRQSNLLSRASRPNQRTFLVVLRRPSRLGTIQSLIPCILLKWSPGYRHYRTTSRLSDNVVSGQGVAGIPYSSLTVGIPRELFPNERRVAITPQNASMLLKKGFSRVLVEQGAGEQAQFLDEQYAAAGAALVDRQELLGSTDVMLKVRPPLLDEEAKHIKEGSTVISYLYPAQNKAIMDTLASRKLNAFAVGVVCIRQ